MFYTFKVLSYVMFTSLTGTNTAQRIFVYL